MKNGILRRIMALILVCTMLAGQVMVNVAYATDIGDIPIISDSEDNIIDFSEDESGNEPTGDDPDDTADFVPPAMFVLPDGDVSPLAEGDNGGISITVTVSPEDEVLKDGQECSLSVVIRDDDIDALPNIEPGDKLTIKMPKFMKPQDVNHWLDNCYQFFESPAEYDPVTNVVVLTFKESQDTTLAIRLNFSMVIDTIGYDGDGKGNIEIGIGDTVKDKVSTGEEIDIDDGTDIENGGGGGTTENKLYKRIWSNSKPSGSGDGLIIRDPNEPIGYTVDFNVTLSKGQEAVLSDDLSNGNLVLCDLTGKTDVSLSGVFTVIVGGKTLTEGKPDGDSLVFSNTSLGTITIAKTENGGFTVTCKNTTDADMTGQVSVVVKYYAKAVGDASYFNNRVKLSIGGETFSDSTFIRKYDNAGLYASKSIGESGAEFIDIEDQAEVTFCITLTQYGTGDIYEPGEKITFDVLEDCFVFKNFKNERPDLFEISVEENADEKQVIKIVKNGTDPIPAGIYKIYFTVSIDSSELNYGEVATNTVGNTVFIRRKAKLTINKEWLGENIDKGSGARFVLYNGDTPIADTGDYTDAGSYTLYIPASALERGEHTYTLKEEVDPNSGYQAAKPVSVVIKRAYGEKDVPDDTVTIISINGIDNTSGSANVAVQNEPDSGMGSLTFKKYGSSDDDEGNILPGGTYKLYRVDNGTNTVVEVNGQDSFTTYNGVITISPLPYGTYYVEEISAPSGYVIEGGATGQITLNKTNPHGTVSLVNKPFTSGEIEILKVDEKNQPLSGVEFKLTGAKSETKTTGSDGKVTFSGLTAGYYTITETLPFGYSGFAGPINVT
ncbi:MAG: collagen binding domain-containing protein, partial [Oscillospiraceae bacterium]